MVHVPYDDDDDHIFTISRALITIGYVIGTKALSGLNEVPFTQVFTFTQTCSILTHTDTLEISVAIRNTRFITTY